MADTTNTHEEDRARHIAACKEIQEKNREVLNKRVEDVIQLLTLNRNQIGAIAMVVLPEHGSAMVEPDGSVSDGVTTRVSLNTRYTREIATHLEELAKPSGPMMPKMPSLEKLLQGLREE